MVLYFTFSLREKCTNTEYFLVCIFPYSDVKGVNLLIKSEYGNIRTRKNSVSGHFSRSISVVLFFFLSLKIPRSKLKHKITMAYEVLPYLLPHQQFQIILNLLSVIFSDTSKLPNFEIFLKL